MITKITLRQKSISKGRKSLYLDFYPPVPNPKTRKLTRREFLGLYITENPKNPIERQHKKETLQLAERIRLKKENLLNKPEIYSDYEKEQLRKKELGEQDFLEYLLRLTNKQKSSNIDNWNAARKYLSDFTNGELRFADLSERLLNDFKDYLLSTNSKRSGKKRLSQNSAASYFNKVKAALRQAFRDGYLPIDLNSKIRPIKVVETKREYLTIDELNKLANTPCKNELLKRASLFSALTGLRFSDIQKLTWGEIEYVSNQGYLIKFTQQKTKGVEVLPISEQAYRLLQTPGNADERVFSELKYSASQNKQLEEWVKHAGILKKITFHSFRHTYATLQLANGTDIYTVSKMLGHRELKTTQVYAKIVDEAKRRAADNIKLDL